MKFESLLPKRLAALEVLLKTGDAQPLRVFFETLPEDYENPDGHDEWRACAARILGLPEDKVPKKVRFAVKHALYAIAFTEKDDQSNAEHSHITPRSTLIELLQAF